MKTWKLVSGLFSIIAFVYLAYQSYLISLASAFINSDDLSGSAGLIVAGLMLIGGITSIATRKDTDESGNVALIMLFGAAAYIGYVYSEDFGDLYIWASCCVCNVLFAILAIFMNVQADKAKNKEIAKTSEIKVVEDSNDNTNK